MAKVMSYMRCKVCDIEFAYYAKHKPNRKVCSVACRIVYTAPLISKSNMGKDWPSNTGKNHYLWKGENAGYISKHIWISKWYGKADRCENTECLGKSTTYDWANLSGEYRRVREDWKRLCRSCHFKMDNKNRRERIRSQL